MNKELRGTIGVMTLNQCLHWFMVGLVLPVLSLFVLEKGMDYLRLGILVAIYSGVTVAAELPTGGLADSLGRKKVYLLSLCCNALGALLLLAASAFPLLALGFAVLGFGRALSSGSMEAHFVDEILALDPKADLQRIMARLGVAVPLALGFASLAGGWLPALGSRLQGLGLLSNKYAANYLAYLLAAFLQFVVTAVLVREARPVAPAASTATASTAPAAFAKPAAVPSATPPSAKPPRATLSRVLKEALGFALRDRTLLLILSGGLVWGFSVSGLEQLWQPRVQELRGGVGSTAIFGWLGFGYFAAAAVGSWASTPLCRLFGGRHGLALGAAKLLMGGFFLLLAGAGRVPAFAALYLLTFAANGLASAPESAVLHSSIPSERRSTLLSLSSLFVQAGGILGSLLMGALAQAYSIGAAWRIAALVLAASSWLYFALPRRAGAVDSEGAASEDCASGAVGAAAGAQAAAEGEGA